MDAGYRRLDAGSFRFLADPLVLHLNLTVMMTEISLEEMWDGARARFSWTFGRNRIQTIQNHEIPFGIIHCWKGCDPFQPIERGKSVHLIVVNLVPCHIPTRPIGLDSLRRSMVPKSSQIEGSPVISERSDPLMESINGLWV